MSMSMTSFSVVSEIAIVPESECRMPTLMVSWAKARLVAASDVDNATMVPSTVRRVRITALFPSFGCTRSVRAAESQAAGQVEPGRERLEI